jgi:hypothetical protein
MVRQQVRIRCADYGRRKIPLVQPRFFPRIPAWREKKLFLAEPETTFINICMTIKEKLNQSEHALFGRGSEKPDPTRKAVCEEDLQAE